MIDEQHLLACLNDIRSAPTDHGSVEMIVRRPAENEREILDEAWLDATYGLEGDGWFTRIPQGLADPDPEAQLTMMNARVSAAVSGGQERWALAGDQLYVDLDISVANLPAGTQLQLGEAIIELRAKPHTGCKKFSARYGLDALRFVMSPEGRELRMRGAHCRVVVSGRVRRGDTITKLMPTSAVEELD